MPEIVDEKAREIFEQYLFSKGCLVNWDGEEPQDCVRVLYALANVFGIKIVRNPQLARWPMVELARRIIGENVPKPFYTGFPQSVLKLTEEQLLIDQLTHYAVTYGLGDFSQPGHSLLEEQFERLAFREHTQPKEFSILDRQSAMDLLKTHVIGLLTSTRPLNEEAEALTARWACLYPDDITFCRCKDTAIRLICETKNISFARFLQLPDVIKLAGEINWQRGLPSPTEAEAAEPPETQAKNGKTVRSLNLRNQDRKVISAVIDFFFEGESPNVRDCYEKRALWAGLLHHIHYVPKNEAAADFARAMRGEGKNRSVYAAFEAAMAQKDVRKAADILSRGKGGGAVARSLNYLLSRCENEADVQAVLDRLDGLNLILLIQMIQQYRHYSTDKRTFKFVQYHLLTMHRETDDEANARRSVLSEPVRAALEKRLFSLLDTALASRRIGKVYVEEGMEKIALPMQEAAGSSGFGVLPRGSRLSVGEGTKLRCFTYWEKTHDIDLACFGLKETGMEQTEFSWRSMAELQDEGITFSGDETSGYEGGSEYFDVVLPKFREKNPDLRYLVFTDNVYGCDPFDSVLCTAGYMLREDKDSGEIFEPKTVQSSFRITGKHTFAILFALDLKEREIIWLNLCMNSRDAVAGENEIAAVRDYLDVTDAVNMASFFRGMATETTARPEDADVIVADRYEGGLREGQTLIRSRDSAKVLEYLNAPAGKNA